MDLQKAAQDQQPNPELMMDIQPPKKTQDFAAPQAVQPADLSGEQAVAPAPEVDNSTDTTSTEPVQAAEPDTPAPVEVPLEAKNENNNHHAAPVLAIISAVVLAAVFATFAVLAYVNKDEPVAKTTEVQTTQKTQPAVSTDVDDTTKAIDDAMSQNNDDTDFNSTAIDDTTLGL